MHSLGVVNVPPELLAEMQKGSRRKQHFNTEAMQRVDEQMQFKTTDGTNFSQVGSNASVLTDNTHTTDGQESVCLVTSAAVEANLLRARQEFHRLSMRLREMCPDHPVFVESTFSENAMDTSLFGSDKSAAFQQLYKETRAKSFRLHACINKVEQSALFDRHSTGSPPPSGLTSPPPSPSASVPDGIREWGGAGIVGSSRSPVNGAGRQRTQGTQFPPPRNGTTGGRATSTGGGFPGARVGEHNGHQDMGGQDTSVVPQGVGHHGAQGRHRGWARADNQLLGSHVPHEEEEWEVTAWEDIVPRPLAEWLPPMSITNHCQCN
jgi:hypothetical protein